MVSRVTEPLSSTFTAKWRNQEISTESDPLLSIPWGNMNLRVNEFTPFTRRLCPDVFMAPGWPRLRWAQEAQADPLENNTKKEKKTWTQMYKGLSCRINSEKQLIRTLVRLSGFQSRHKVACETADSRCSCLMDRLAGPQLLFILSFANYCPRVARGSWAATENNRDNCNKGGKRAAVGPECLTATIMSACVCRLHKQPVQRLIVQRPSAFS